MSGEVVGVTVVRNKHLGPSVYFDESSKTPYEWKDFNDPNENDFQEVPDHVVKQPNFRKAVSRGVFEIIENDDSRLYISGQIWQDARSTSLGKIEATMDRQSERSITAAPCIGPGVNGTNCGAGVILSGNSNSSAPLCAAHKHLSSSYALVTGEDGKDNWVRANLTKRNQID